jgi:hypothetical protein
LISYGIASGKYIYGNPNIGRQGTTSYTVGSLTGGKTYYFVVAASNSCGASGFSNEMSVIAEPIPITPAPTIEPVPTPEALTTDTSSDMPTDTPEEVAETSTPAPAVQNGGINIENIAIALLASGIVLLGIIVVVQKTKSKKNLPIPPMMPPIGENPPPPLSY